MRWVLIVLFSLASFSALGYGISRRKNVSFLAITPPLLYALLVGLATFLEVYFVHSLQHSKHWFWVLAWFVYGYGLVFPVLYVLACWAAARKRFLNGLLKAVTITSVPLGLITFYATFVEPAMLAEREYEFVSELAPEEGLLILHVSDLQTDGTCRREELAREAIKTREPDLVIFTGDIANDSRDVDERQGRIEAAQLFFRDLKGRLGVYAVPGDWDGWVDDWPELLSKFLDGSDVTWLDNQQVELLDGRVVLYGVGGGPGFSHEPVPPDFSGTTGLRIVVAHHPDDIDDLIPPGGADLALVGHTHGGQVVLPFVGALITHSDLGFAGGMHANHGVPLLISRGIGMRGSGAPRIRLGCRPEISWVTIKRP